MVGSPERRDELENVRWLVLRYRSSQPAEAELAVEYAGGRVVAFRVGRYTVQHLLACAEQEAGPGECRQG